MANILYNAGMRDLFVNGKTLATGVYKAMLERSTSTYTPNKDHDLINPATDFTGFVEITVASYLRKTITTPTVAEVDASDLVKLDFDDVAFGSLEAGQTVKSIIVFRFVTDDTDSVPLARIDTDTGALLPRALGGGAFTLQISASGFITVAQA
jgi:hypothetical protein